MRVTFGGNHEMGDTYAVARRFRLIVFTLEGDFCLYTIALNDIPSFLKHRNLKLKS